MREKHCGSKGGLDWSYCEIWREGDSTGVSDLSGEFVDGMKQSEEEAQKSFTGQETQRDPDTPNKAAVIKQYSIQRFLSLWGSLSEGVN